MNKLERATRRANLALLLGGLASLIICSAVSLVIWFDPNYGPDLRSGFILFLVPAFALGGALALWGACERFQQPQTQRKRRCPPSPL
jgi:4-amino-4-deoxy-L-arabinose transferase-like glycosyltransferase